MILFSLLAAVPDRSHEISTSGSSSDEEKLPCLPGGSSTGDVFMFLGCF